jgi:subtilase family serine protease
VRRILGILGLALPCLFLLSASTPAAGAASPLGAPERTVEVLLELQHPAGLERFVKEVSDPASPRYRRYSTVEALARRFGAGPKAKQATVSWLAAHGLRGTVGPTGTYVSAPVSPGTGSRLLPRPAGAEASAAADPSARAVPPALRGIVTAAAVLSGREGAFKNVASASRARASAEQPGYSSILPHSGSARGCEAGRIGPGGDIAPPFTPNQYLGAYGIKSMHARGLRGKGVRVALVEVDGFRRSDIASFDRCFGVKTPPVHVVPVAPLRKPFSGGTETTLDLEVLSAAAPGLKDVDVYEGAGSEGGVVLSAGTALGSPRHRPDVISISLGFCEPRFSEHLVFRRALDSIFATAAGAGISVLVAAGDTGSSGCRVENQAGTTALPIRTVSLPSSSPFVTAVGGTNLRLDAKNRIRAEIVWNDSPLLTGGGGGGVSLLTPRRPWWQHVPAVFGIGRVVPDIAALADVFPGYSYFCTSPECEELTQLANHGWTSIGGTSAATPLMAGGIALADQMAASHRQRDLGFLDPLIYSLAASRGTKTQAFRDVHKGNDDLGALLDPELGGGHPLGCCEASEGYDWASGWGSLKVVGFAQAAYGAAR